jgi:glc operon protein GlcG
MNKLFMKPVLTLEAAKVISAAAESEAERNGWAVAIAVTDDRGELIHFIRKDNTTNAAIGIAQKKAFRAANYRRNTLFHEKLLAEGSSNIGVLSLPDCMPIEGGIPLMHEGIVIGAIGVSGLASDDDGRVAQKGCDAFNDILETIL